MKNLEFPQTPLASFKLVFSRVTYSWSHYKESILSLLAFTGQRLAFGILVLLFIIFLSYLGLDMATGTDFSTALRNAIPNTIVYVQDLLHGKMGLTTAGSETLLPRPVTEVIQERFPRSLGLLGASLLLASLVGVGLGILAARNRFQRSLGILLATIIGVSIPSFFVAFLLQWMVTSLTQRFGSHILPVGGFGWDSHIVLPMLVLAARPIAQITRMTFITIKQALEEDYVRTATSKGLRNSHVMLVHIMRNAAIPILTTIGISLRFSLSSLPIVELYFGWPGIGVTLLKGISQQDANLVIGLTLCLGVVFILINLLLELSYRIIDPRLLSRLEHIATGERRNPLEVLKKFWAGLRELLTDNPLTSLFRGRSQAQPQNHYDFSELTSVSVDETPARSSSLRGAWKAVLRNYLLIVGGVMVLGLLTVLLFGPDLAPNNPLHTQGLVNIDGQLTPPPFPPSEIYPWGTDALGRDIMSLILAGAQQTLMLAMLAVAARLLVGFVLGAIAGWTNGSLLDRSILGLAEVISAFPTLLMVMIIILALGVRQGIQSFVIALCFVGWCEIMQFIRSEIVSIRPRPFVESAVAVGAGTLRIINRHVLPNLFSALISIAVLEMGAVLMLLGELGFIGIFIGGGSLMALPSMTILYSDVPEWGALLSNIRYLVRSYPWVGLYPMMAFFIAIVSFNLFGEGLRRMVEEGNPLFNRAFNRYTALLGLVAVLAYNWWGANSGVTPFYRQQASEFDGARALSHTSILADPRVYGRALGSPGADFTAIYIARQFEAMGLQSGGENNSFYQERKRGFERLLSEPILIVEDGGSLLDNGVDYSAYPGINASMGMTTSPVRYIGLGELANLQSGGWHIHFPDLDKADYTGEVLLTLSDREAYYLNHVPKDGLLVVTDDPARLKQRYTLSGRSAKWLNFSGKEMGQEYPSLWISKQTAERLLAGSGYNVDKLVKNSAELGYEQVYALPLKTSVTMAVHGSLEDRWPVKNVVGLWPGSVSFDNCYDCPAKKLIVVIAQYDSPPIGPEGVYPAANDNASGVAVMLETIRAMRESEYQPYKSFLFVAFSGEGLDGGEPVNETDVSKILQVRPSFSNFEVEAIVVLRGLGYGSSDRLELSAGGSLRLTKLFENAARQMGVDTVRSSEPIDISVIYDEGRSTLRGGQEAPVIHLFWEGWEASSRLPTDVLGTISANNLQEAGRVLSLSLMTVGRDSE